MWPFKKKKIHNPDCYMCSERWYDLKPKGKCSKVGCDRPAEGVIFHFWARGSGCRWTYVCYEHEVEHNQWFYGKNLWNEPMTVGWLFTPSVLPPLVTLPPPDPNLISWVTRCD